MEPVLPGHRFMSEDWWQLLVGIACAVLAYKIFVSKSVKSEKEAITRANDATGTTYFFLSFGLTFFFAFPVLDNFEYYFEPYGNFVYNILKDTEFQPNRGDYGGIGMGFFIIAIVITHAVAGVKAIFISALSLYSLRTLIRKEIRADKGIKELPFYFIFIFYPFVMLIYAIGYM